MRKEIFKVDINGFIIDNYIAEVAEDGSVSYYLTDELKPSLENIEGLVTKSLPSEINLFIPKWNGSEWIEGESKSERTEREALLQLELLKPSPKDLEKAERELEIIQLLLEMEMLQ